MGRRLRNRIITSYKQPFNPDVLLLFLSHLSHSFQSHYFQHILQPTLTLYQNSTLKIDQTPLPYQFTINYYLVKIYHQKLIYSPIIGGYVLVSAASTTRITIQVQYIAKFFKLLKTISKLIHFSFRIKFIF